MTHNPNVYLPTHPVGEASMCVILRCLDKRNTEVPVQKESLKRKVKIFLAVSHYVNYFIKWKVSISPLIANAL
jgi:hypothetical protein